MANTNSLTIGNTTVPVANTLASLDDTNIPANPAAGSLLTLQNGKWTPNTVEGAIGGKPVFSVGNFTSAAVANNGTGGLQLQGVYNDGSQYAVSFVDGDRIELWKALPGQAWQRNATFSKDEYTGWIYLQSEYMTRLRYCKKNGIVFVDVNDVVSIDLPAGGTAIATMPEGFRPSDYATFAIGTHGGTGVHTSGFGYISPDGHVYIGFRDAFPAHSAFIDGSVSYPAA